MPLLEITLRGHLLVAGGQATDLGIDLSTARRYDGRDWIPYIPATALRGAIRLQLEALLGGTAAPAVGPYPAERDPGPVDPVCRLFGYSGPLRERAGALEGALRFGDALPVDPQAVLRSLAVRPGLEIDDALSSAAPAKLFFREVAEIAQEPLVFQAPLEVADAGKADVFLLRAAIETTEAIGAGKSSGGGALSIRWIDGGVSPGTQVEGRAATATRARLTLTLTEPAHFGDGGPLGNHHATRKHIPGATVRGALAWALLRSGRLTAESAEFRALFLDETAPVSFGDALLSSGAAGITGIQPATRRKRRGPGRFYDDILVRELARDRVNTALLSRGLHLRSEDGDDRFDPIPPRPEDGLVRRTRTRVSIDRFKGASADGRLFSIEQIEPWLLEKEPVEAVRFVSNVEGPSPASPSPLHHLALLADLPVLVGAGRNHGLGRVEVKVELEPEPAAEGLADRVRGLGKKVETFAVGLARRADLPGLGEGLGAQLLPLALVALADYVPSSPGHPHPLAEPVFASAGFGALQPVRAFLHPGSSGGYDQIPSRAPLKELIPAIGAGSVFVYGVEDERLAQILAVLFPALRRGVGRRVESGCGRFELFDSTSKEQR